MVMMKALLFIILAGYAVRCDDTYYIVQKPEMPKNDLKVYWNVPTMQCKSKNIPFDDLYARYGIIQNTQDHHRGDRISILYDPGNFPALIRNETTGEIKYRNGGVPQRGELIDHLQVFKHEMEKSIPDKNFSGIGIIDFESWRPILRQNFGVLTPYKDVSFDIEKKRHWWWKKQWIQEEAQHRFEAAARDFMQTTLALAKKLRPKGLWGYYGYPQCFNRPFNNNPEKCGNEIPAENDQINWLWTESTALFPSVYSTEEMSAVQLAAFIRGRIKEASRVRGKNVPILPYWWLRYRDAGYFSESDLDVTLNTFHNSNATGFIIWGSSKDVNTREKCVKLKTYVTNILGPAVARYTKQNFMLQNEENDQEIPTTTTTTTTTTTSTVIPEIVTEVDPEYTWIPPSNYSQNIETIAEEIKKDNDIEKHKKIIESVLVDLILHKIAYFCSENCIPNANSTPAVPASNKTPKDKRENNVSLTTEDDTVVYYDEETTTTTDSIEGESSSNFDVMNTEQASDIFTFDSPVSTTVEDTPGLTTNSLSLILDYIYSTTANIPEDMSISTSLPELKTSDNKTTINDNLWGISYDEKTNKNNSYEMNTYNGTINDLFNCSGRDNNTNNLTNSINENNTYDSITFESYNRSGIISFPSNEIMSISYTNSSEISGITTPDFIIKDDTQSGTTDGPSIFHFGNIGKYIFNNNDDTENYESSTSINYNNTFTKEYDITTDSTQESDVSLYETSTFNPNDTIIEGNTKTNKTKITKKTSTIKWNIRFRDSEKNASNSVNKTTDHMYTRQVIRSGANSSPVASIIFVFLVVILRCFVDISN